MSSLLAILLLTGLTAVQEKKELKVGDKAPEFTLKNHENKDVTLSKTNKEHWVVLAFYPKANTPG